MDLDNEDELEVQPNAMIGLALNLLTFKLTLIRQHPACLVLSAIPYLAVQFCTVQGTSFGIASLVLAAASLTANSFLGPAAVSSGAAKSQAGGALVLDSFQIYRRSAARPIASS